MPEGPPSFPPLDRPELDEDHDWDGFAPGWPDWDRFASDALDDEGDPGVA